MRSKRIYNLKVNMKDNASIVVENVIFSLSPWRQDNHLITCYKADDPTKLYSFVMANVLFYEFEQTGETIGAKP